MSITSRFHSRITRILAIALLALVLPASSQGAKLKAVQSGSLANAPNGTTYVPIAHVDPAKTFLLFSTRHNYNEPTGSMLRGRIFSADSLEFVRVGDAADTTPIQVEWSVVEYATGVRVQRGEILQTATSVNATLPTPVGALDRAFVTWSKTPSVSNTTFGAGQPIFGLLTTTSNLQFRSGAAAADNVISWQVVEYLDPADIKVQSGVLTTMGTAALSVTATLGTAVDPTKAFVLIGCAMTGGGQDIGSRMLRAVLTNPTTITIDRNTVGAFPPDNITEIGWQAIELRDGSRVQGASENFPLGTAQKLVALSSVDLSRSVAFGSDQLVGGQSTGRSPYVADDVVGVGAFSMRVTSPTQVTITRNSTVDASDVGWFVVEFGDVSDLVMAKSASNPTPNEGDPVAYTVTVTNNGPDAATGVQVTDLLPAGVTFSSYIATQGTYVSGTGAWTVGSLANAASATLTLNVTVNAGVGGTTIVNSAAVAASNQLDANVANDSASAGIAVQSQAPDETQITSGTAQDQRPSWSPDESTLVFDSDRTGNPDLWLVPSTGGAVTQLTTNALLDRHPDWSPDGTKIVYCARIGGGNPSPDLWMIPPTGGVPTHFQADVSAEEEFPAWSRDGSRVAFTKAGDIWVVPSTGGSPLQLTTDPGNDTHPSWSPDGTQIVFVSDRTGSNDLWVVPSIGGTQTQIDADPASDGAPDWSPDGTRIAFQSNRSGGNTDVWLIPAAGGVAVRVTTDAAFDVQPDWSPTGGRIAFARDGDIRIYSFPVDLAVTHVVNDANPDPGDTITYTVVVSNGGPKPATGVVVTDILPAGLTFQSASATQGSYSVGTGLWTIGDIPYGVSRTLQVTCVVNLGTGGATIACTASAKPTNQADRDPTDDQATATLIVRTVLAISSAANQSFFVGAAPAAIAAITITDDSAAPSITNGNDLRIRIPAGVGMTWNVGDVTATIGGPAAAKVSPTVTYEDAGKTLVVDVSTSFAAGDRIIISGLSFMSFTTPSNGRLELEVHNDNLVSALDDKTVTIIDPTGVPVTTVPIDFALAPPRPNPVRSGTTLQFDVPARSTVHLRLLDVAGRVVRTLVSGEVEAGSYRPVWDGRNDAGQRVGTGVYFVRLETGSFHETRKLVLLR